MNEKLRKDVRNAYMFGLSYGQYMAWKENARRRRNAKKQENRMKRIVYKGYRDLMKGKI